METYTMDGILEEIKKPSNIGLFCQDISVASAIKEKIIQIMTTKYPEIPRVVSELNHNDCSPVESMYFAKLKEISRLLKASKREEHQRELQGLPRRYLTLSYNILEEYRPDFTFRDKFIRCMFSNGRNYQTYTFYIGVLPFELKDTSNFFSKIPPNLRMNFDAVYLCNSTEDLQLYYNDDIYEKAIQSPGIMPKGICSTWDEEHHKKDENSTY